MSLDSIYFLIDKATKQDRLLTNSEIDLIKNMIVKELHNDDYVDKIEVTNDKYSYYDPNSYNIYIANRYNYNYMFDYLTLNLQIVEDLFHELKHAEQNMIVNENMQYLEEYDLLCFLYNNSNLDIGSKYDPRETDANRYTRSKLIELTKLLSKDKKYIYYTLINNNINDIKNNISTLDLYINSYNNKTNNNISPDIFKIVNSKDYKKKFNINILSFNICYTYCIR